MIMRRIAVCTAALACLALVWAPYFRSYAFTPIRLADFGTPSSVALWLARGAVVLVFVAAGLAFTRQVLATSITLFAAAAMIVGAAVVTINQAHRTFECAGWTFYTPHDPPSCLTGEARVTTWGWTAMLLLVLGAFAACLDVAAVGDNRAVLGAAIGICVVSLALASFGPVFEINQGQPRRYVDYAGTSSGQVSGTGWHGGYLPAALALLALTVVAFVWRREAAAMIAALALGMVVVAGVNAPRPVWFARPDLGWGYWVLLACAAALFALVTRPWVALRTPLLVPRPAESA